MQRKFARTSFPFTCHLAFRCDTLALFPKWQCKGKSPKFQGLSAFPDPRRPGDKKWQQNVHEITEKREGNKEIKEKSAHGSCKLSSLSGPISHDIAILSLRYPISRDTFWGKLSPPHNGAIPPLVLGFTQAHLCDTPFCYISRDIL